MPEPIGTQQVARRRGKAYLSLVRRLKNLLVHVLIAAQLLLVVPAMASVPAAAPAGAEMPCDGMPMPASDDPCPCCPDGTTSMTACLVSCLLAATAAPMIFTTQVESIPTVSFVEVPHAANAFSEPPLKPPPIG